MGKEIEIKWLEISEALITSLSAFIYWIRDLQGCKHGFKGSARKFLKIFFSKVLFFKLNYKKNCEQVFQFCDTGREGRLK